MKILYIGPYRQNNDYGIMSKLHLQNLVQSNHHITSRPIYFSENHTERFAHDPLQYENIIHENYDYLIQYCPIDMLQRHGGFPKNIAIPIFGRTKNVKSHTIKTLNMFDKVIVDNDMDESSLVRAGSVNHITKITHPIIKDLIAGVREKKLNLGIHNSATQFYFFGSIENDLDILQKILVSFYISFKGGYGKSLILFLDDTDKQNQIDFLNSIKEIKEKLKLNSSKSSVSEFVIFKNLSFEEKIVAHNTCHVFLNFGEKRILQEEYAKLFGNTILNSSNIETVDVPSYNANDYCIGDLYESIVTESLIDNFKKSAVNPHKTETITSDTRNIFLSSIL